MTKATYTIYIGGLMKTQTQISGRLEAIQGMEFHSQVLPNELFQSLPQSASPGLQLSH